MNPSPLSLSFFLLSVLLPSPLLPAFAQAPVTGVDQRIELLTIVYRLAGNPEYNQCRVPRYAAAIDAWFAPHREHPTIQLARQIRNARGVGFDAVMSMAVHLTSAEDPREREAFDSPNSSLESRWNGAAHGRPFVESLRSFVADANVAGFFASQQALYDTANARIAQVLRQEVDLAWFARFFGVPPQEGFRLVPGLCNGGGSYGPAFRQPDGRREVYAIIGVAQTDRDGWPRASGFGATVVHEFNHSFVNPLLGAHRAQFEAAGPDVLRPVSVAMRNQAYGSWATVLNESVVRAAAARYALAHHGDSAARAEIGREHSRSFLWTGELFNQLGYYEAHRDSFPTLASFVPRLAAWWRDLAPRVAGMVADYDARRPRLVRREPAGDTLGAATTELVFHFDRPMSGGYSMNLGPGGRQAFPRVIGQAWDSTRTAFTMRVQLEPGRAYHFLLNSPMGGGFQSAEGIAALQERVSFVTR